LGANKLGNIYFLLFDSGYGSASSVLGVVASHTRCSAMYFLAGLVVAGSAILNYILPYRRMLRKEKLLLQ
jgi:hypothetical protein